MQLEHGVSISQKLQKHRQLVNGLMLSSSSMQISTRTWYLNGVMDSFIGIASAESKSAKTEICANVHFGAKNNPGHFATNMGIDEIKYMYRSLSNEGLFVRYTCY